MSKYYPVDDATSLLKVVIRLTELVAEGKPFRVGVQMGRDRSLSQNALSHAIYAQIARERGDASAAEVKEFCRITFGMPILRENRPEFDAACEEMFAGKNEMQRYALAQKFMDMIPVSSELTTLQFSDYLKRIRDHYGALEVDPVHIELPE